MTAKYNQNQKTKKSNEHQIDRFVVMKSFHKIVSPLCYKNHHSVQFWMRLVSSSGILQSAISSVRKSSKRAVIAYKRVPSSFSNSRVCSFIFVLARYKCDFTEFKGIASSCAISSCFFHYNNRQQYTISAFH